jgi:hypothetical protein
MKPNVFISYSRREVGFVDDLASKLQKGGFKVWLDYRNLIPGEPWEDQINKGLDEAQVVLLVVSKTSIDSHNVELEWMHALNQGDKRIILVIFEAVKLPAELEKYEWVDFRGNYKKAVQRLIERLQSPVQKDGPVPMRGVKVPSVVWWSIAASALLGVMSLFAFWTLLLPLLLIPLPFRIMKRNFNFAYIQAALWFLPLGIIYTNLNIPESGPTNDLIMTAFGIAFLGGVFLLFLIRSQGMQRWGKPEATMPRFANPYQPNNPNPRPVPFYIDCAPPDQRITASLAGVLTKYKHPQVQDMQSAEAIFVLISPYKTDTDADPEKKVVFPVLVQTAEPSEKLSKIQWIDFRRGLRNLDAIAQLLPDPALLLSALGVRPTGKQVVLPPIITWMSYLVIMAMTFAVGGFISDFFTFISADLGLGTFLFQLLCLGIALWLGIRMVSALRGRRGRLASVVGSVSAYVGFGIALASLAYSNPGSLEANSTIPVTFSALLVYGGGGIILLVLALTVWRADYQRWLPWTAPRAK